MVYSSTGCQKCLFTWYIKGDCLYASAAWFSSSRVTGIIKCDNSLFIYRKGTTVAYLLLYVDDIILTTSTAELRVHLIDLLAREFSMKDLGPLSYVLGIAVKRHANSLFLNQTTYAKDIIARASLSNCNQVLTPVDTTPKLGAKDGLPVADPTKFRSLEGALQYLTFTRPDISYAVQRIFLHMHNPRESHLHALRRIVRYLQGTLDYGLHLYKNPNRRLIAYTDVDWAGCPDSRCSTSGYCVYFGDNLISWSSKLQPTLSRSSAEAEYRGVANVVSDTCWIRNLLLELHCLLPKCTLVFFVTMSPLFISRIIHFCIMLPYKRSKRKIRIPIKFTNSVHNLQSKEITSDQSSDEKETDRVNETNAVDPDPGMG
ncbi:uncharacterized mitochondrial protein AtMg00810-like [Rutidosis leptorrhynchoides]|uniref:uncharacterized mitochondrial protein AtMg00810-like n=1 Tax=Rutidosis leptorrhynchoides TaxID=125765 RepID=UPI003A99F732